MPGILFLHCVLRYKEVRSTAPLTKRGILVLVFQAISPQVVKGPFRQGWKVTILSPFGEDRQWQSTHPALRHEGFLQKSADIPNLRESPVSGDDATP
jgi:hypothetical protein